MALELDYIPLPDSAVKLIEASWGANLKTKDGKAIYSIQ